MENKTNKLGEFCKMMIKHSSSNIEHPLPLIKEKAEKRLSTDGLISFNIILKEFNRMDLEDKKEVSKLLLLSCNKIVDVMDATHELLEETKDVFDYISEHPEVATNEVTTDDILKDIEGLLDI